MLPCRLLGHLTGGVLTCVPAVAMALLASACATYNHVSNAPLPPEVPADMGAPHDILGENVVALSFSGGGLRAAAFSYGVLLALRDSKTPEGDLLDDISFISSVSGGSLTSAYFGLYGRDSLDQFRADVLLQDFEAGMRTSFVRPTNLLRLLGGGVNAREDLAEPLDRNVFHRATFADLYRRGKPDIRIHATDLYHRFAFPFIPRAFEALCSDLRSYAIADAVAASMAVPLVFAPVVVRAYPEHCTKQLPRLHVKEEVASWRLLRAMERGLKAYRDPAHTRYIKLVDGGVTDNLGLSTLLLTRAINDSPIAPMSEREAVRVRRLLFLVVDATRGPTGDWTLRPDGPDGLDVAMQSTDAAIDASARLAADAFGRMLREWRDAVVRFRCGLPAGEIVRLGGPADFRCDDVVFRLEFISIDQLPDPYRDHVDAIPTRLSLDAAQIDTAVEAARQATLALPGLQATIDERNGRAVQASP